MKPAGYQADGDQRYPMILAFHGGGDGNTGLNMEVNWVDDRGGERFLVFPDAESGIWNARGNGGPAEDVDPLRDVRFAGAVVDHVAAAYRVDSNQVVAVGFSNGSALVWELLCSAPERYAGFAMIALGMTDRTAADCSPPAVRPALYMHGTADSSYDGERFAEQFVPGGVQLVSAARTLEAARAAMGCGEPEVRELPDLAPDDETRVKLSEHRCRGGAAFRYYEIDGGGHVWPGKTPRRDRGGKNRSTRDIDANDEILGFFGLR